jgi:glutathione S-transferase
MKARIALNYKEIPYTNISINPQDRSEVIKASGQPRTPVLVHEGRVVYDSAAILRYLDANFRNTRPLFSQDYATMGEIEKWEGLARWQIAESTGIIFGQYFAETKSRDEIDRASDLLHERTDAIEKRLRDNPWLVGDGMTAADVTAAPSIIYGMLSPEAAKLSPIHEFFAASLKLGDGRDKTRAWVQKVMVYDR